MRHRGVGAGVEHRQGRGAPLQRQGLVGGAERGDHHLARLDRRLQGDLHLRPPQLQPLVHQPVGQVAPNAALPDEPQLRLALDVTKPVHDVPGPRRLHALADDLRQEGTVVAVDVQIAVRVVADPRLLGAQPHLLKEIGKVEQRVLGAAGGVLRVDLDPGDPRRLRDVLLLQVRDQRPQSVALGWDHDRHRPLGAEVEEAGDVGHPDRVEEHQRVQLPCREFLPHPPHPGVVLRLLDPPPDRRRLSPKPRPPPVCVGGEQIQVLGSLVLRLGRAVLRHPDPPLVVVGRPLPSTGRSCPCRSPSAGPG